MHCNVHESSLLVHRLQQHIHTHRDIEVVIAPTMLSLQPVSQEIDKRKLRLASQDAFAVDEGGQTGEVSFAMLRHLVQYGIIGHSSRRLMFGETLEMVREKVAAAVRNDITPVICVGETKQERQAGEAKQVVHDQLTTALANLTSHQVAEVVIAYEPIWAISTFDGETAKPDDMQDMLDYIREQLAALHGQKVARAVRVLYGGSVDDEDALAYLQLKGCDGVLVGAASLNYKKFASIAHQAHVMNIGGRSHAKFV